MQSSGIDPIFLLAPTSTDDRIAALAQVASGYVYYVSLKGVTGSANLDVASIASKIPAIKSRIALPVGVGFRHPGRAVGACGGRGVRCRRDRQPYRAIA